MNIDRTLSSQLDSVYRALSKYDEDTISFILAPYFEIIDSDSSDSDSSSSESRFSYDSEVDDSSRPRVSNTNNSISSDSESDASYARAYSDMEEEEEEEVSYPELTNVDRFNERIKKSSRKENPRGKSRLDRIRDEMERNSERIANDFYAPSETIAPSVRTRQPEYVQRNPNYPPIQSQPFVSVRDPKINMLNEEEVVIPPTDNSNVPGVYTGIQQCIAVMLD